MFGCCSVTVNSNTTEEETIIYTSWKAQNQDRETATSAGNAAELLCKKYLIPANTNTQATIRSSKARTIYEKIVENVF